MPTPSSAQSPYGILLNEIDHTTPRAEIAARMAMARQANASWIRLDFYWYSVEWTRGAFNWTYFDTLVQEANAHGLSIVGTMGWPAAVGGDGRCRLLRRAGHGGLGELRLADGRPLSRAGGHLGDLERA